MWYLIAPPFIVVLLMAFLVWFLAKRASEPSVLARMESLSRQESASGSAIGRMLKRFGLKFLDRATHSLKVLTLRAHNVFHSASQGIKRKRNTLLEKNIFSSENEKGEGTLTETPNIDTENAKSVSFEHPKQESKHPFFARRRKVSEGNLEEVDTASMEAYLREENTKEEIISENTPPLEILSEEVRGEVSSKKKHEIPTRPMVAETVAVPEELERERERVRENAIRENALIKRIAANPKSVSAYEALGDFYLEHGNVNDAKSCYKQVLKLSPVHRSVKMKIRRLERMIEERS